MVKLLFWVIFNRSALGIFCYSHWPTRTKPYPPNLLSSYKKFRCKNIKKQTIYSDIPLLLMFAHLIWSLVVLALKILLSFSETVKINNSDNVFVSPVYTTQFQWQMLILQKQFFPVSKKKIDICSIYCCFGVILKLHIKAEMTSENLPICQYKLASWIWWDAFWFSSFPGGSQRGSAAFLPGWMSLEGASFCFGEGAQCGDTHQVCPLHWPERTVEDPVCPRWAQHLSEQVWHSMFLLLLYFQTKNVGRVSAAPL